MVQDAPDHSERIKKPRRTLQAAQSDSERRDGVRRSRPLRTHQTAAMDVPDRSSRHKLPQTSFRTPDGIIPIAPHHSKHPNRTKSRARTRHPHQIGRHNTISAPNCTPEHRVRTKSRVRTTKVDQKRSKRSKRSKPQSSVTKIPPHCTFLTVAKVWVAGSDASIARLLPLAPCARMVLGTPHTQTNKKTI